MSYGSNQRLNLILDYIKNIMAQNLLQSENVKKPNQTNKNPPPPTKKTVSQTKCSINEYPVQNYFKFFL